MEKYAYTNKAVHPHREYARKIYANYLLDRPRRTTQSGWPKPPGPETFHRHAYPYSLTEILQVEADQDVDIELNK